jgi:hypothetical protein
MFTGCKEGIENRPSMRKEYLWLRGAARPASPCSEIGLDLTGTSWAPKKHFSRHLLIVLAVRTSARRHSINAGIVNWSG